MSSILTGAFCTGLRPAAFGYLIERYSVIPLIGKRCSLKSWAYFQRRRAQSNDLIYWERAGLLKNVGIVCGRVSENLVVIDLDGPQAIGLFYEHFPQFKKSTFTVATNYGKHVYFQVEQLPANRKVTLGEGHNGIEIRGEGLYVVAPPSIHPTTNKPYQISVFEPVRHVFDLSDVLTWLNALEAPKRAPAARSDSSPEKPNIGWNGNKLFLRGRDGKPHHIRYPVAYARSALHDEARRVGSANPGTRNNTLHLAAVRMGQLVYHRLLSESEIENALWNAARGWSGISAQEIIKTIHSGIKNGLAMPQGDFRA